MSEPDLLAALEPVVDALERLGVRYQVAGSVASSVHGMARSTMDVDVVAELEDSHVGELVRSLQGDYFIDENQVRAAVRDRASFNLIHQATIMKIDVFLPKQRLYDRQALARGIDETIAEDPESRSIRFAAAEDVILAKLEWYRLGNETSERQWADVLGILRVQRDRLDVAYLRRWAVELGVEDLLARALGEVAG